MDEVYCIDHPHLKSVNSELYVNALEQLYQKVNPDVILMGWTLDHLDLAPRLAHRMGVQLITDRVQLSVEPGPERLTQRTICNQFAFQGERQCKFAEGASAQDKAENLVTLMKEDGIMREIEKKVD